MTARLGEHADALLAAVETLAELELQFAKARFAEDYDCVAVSAGRPPRRRRRTIADARNRGDALVLRNARHPLLERTLEARRGLQWFRSRSNSTASIARSSSAARTPAAKPLALKTIGLLALMAQSGVPVPAERAELPIFDAVFADIGDYQSIEQNLSTFSAHVTNIDFISHQATAQSLVLLDELGSATDPEEGAALAVSIADYFRRTACISVISTHHTALKVYAANTPGVLNAAVGFDENTLAPTYELRIGVPGASAGINIAQKLGLNPRHCGSCSPAPDFAGAGCIALPRPPAHRAAATRHRAIANCARASRKWRGRSSHLELEGRKEQREKLRELEKKLDSLLHDFEYRVRETVNAVQDRAQAQKLSKDAERRIAKMRREFREQFDSTVVAHSTGADQGDPNAQQHIVKQVSVGDTVRLRSLGRDGRVLRYFDDDSFEIAVGPMKMKVARDDIASVVAQAGGNPVQAARSKGINVSLAREDDSVPTEINVIGQTVDEATQAVEKFVDRAFLAGAVRLRVVHGSGMGILRKALRQFLKAHPHVATVSEPPQNEGGGGATVVELRT